MSSDIRILDPLGDPNWDERIRAQGRGSFFLTSSWARVLTDSYGYQPRYFGEVRNASLATLLPFMEVNSMLTGKRGVSLPFTDQCEPIMNGAAGWRAALDHAIAHGKRSGWQYLELRPGTSLTDNVLPFTICYGHRLDLTGGTEALYRGLRDSTRRNIRRAQSAGVTVAVSMERDALQEFCRMNWLTRRVHGLPPQPACFFDNIHHHVLDRGRGRVFLASCNGSMVAGAVYFHFGRKAVYKYGASDQRYQHLRANNLIMWEAIRTYAGEAYASLDLGRTEPENEGLLQFKRGWGGEEQRINYYKYDLRTDSFVAGKLSASGPHTAVFRHLPLPLLRAAGTLLYRHVG